MPEPQTVHRSLATVLRQYQSRARLLEELLTSTELAKERQSAIAAGVHLLQQCASQASDHGFESTGVRCMGKIDMMLR